jgi:hypothetical protein
MARVFLVILLGALVAVGVGIGVVRWQNASTTSVVTTAAAPPPADPEAARRIRVNLFYVDAGGMDLVAVEREVPYAKGIADQARIILEEQLKAPDDPLGALAPEGVSVRAFYLTDKGDGFADFSTELASADVGGSLDEMLTVYGLVNAVTVNVPLVKTMQILVNGHEIDTLAGHIDLRQPLRKNTSLVKGARTTDAAGDPNANPAESRAPAPQAGAPEPAVPSKRPVTGAAGEGAEPPRH